MNVSIIGGLLISIAITSSAAYAHPQSWITEESGEDADTSIIMPVKPILPKALLEISSK